MLFFHFDNLRIFTWEFLKLGTVDKVNACLVEYNHTIEELFIDLFG